jgi:integrase
MKRRRGRGEGAIYLRADGCWCGAISLPASATRKRRRQVVYGRTKQQVVGRIAQLQADLASGILVATGKLTVAELIQRWLFDVVRNANRPTTLALYVSLAKNHILPAIGHQRLSQLTPLAVQSFYSELERKGISPRTRQMIHARLHRALNQAVKWGLVARNVCDAVEKPAAPRPTMRVLDSAQVKKFLMAAQADRYSCIYVLAVTTGLRQGELLALHWDDIHLRDGSLSVRHTLQELNGRLELVEPKTAKGRRRVDLPALAMDALRDHRKRMFAEGHPGPWVFCDSKGGPLRKGNLVRRSFNRVLRTAELPRIRFHDLRHTAATLLLQEGVHPKVVQERLGHAQIGLTLDTYSHVLPTMQREAADRLDRILS